MTRSQAKIAALIAKGHTNKEVADLAGVTPAAVVLMTNRIYRQLGFGGWGNNRVRLVLHLQRETPRD